MKILPTMTTRKLVAVTVLTWIMALTLLLVAVLEHAGTEKRNKAVERGTNAMSAALTDTAMTEAERAAASGTACFWHKGKVKWCVQGWSTDEWSVGQYEGAEHVGRYYVENHKNEVRGYLRPTRYGWRAMVPMCFMDARPCGWARGGNVVRMSRNAYSSSARLDIYKKGKRVGIARGSEAIVVAACKLILGGL